MFFSLLALFLVDLSSLGFLLFIVIYTSPKTPSGSLIWINLVYFFVASFLSLAATLTLVLYWLSNLREKQQRKVGFETVHRPKLVFKRSLRQGVIIALTVVGIGILNSLKFSNPLNIILLITAAVIIEIYFFGH